MSEQPANPGPVGDRDDEPSLLTIGSGLLRGRRTILTLGFVGAIVGLATGLLTARVYRSSAVFIPQGSQEAASGLALAASEFGIRLPTASGTWGPAVYVELLRSRALLESIAVDSVVVAEESGRSILLMDLLEIEASTPARRLHRAIERLSKIVRATEDKRLGAVRLSVTTEWPSVSLLLAQRLVLGVNQFNVETRRSQATAERQFVELQAREAERVLRDSEDRLLTFLQRNRTLGGSSELAFQRDRLQREVELRQNVYTALVHDRDEARIREVRDTPVITVLEGPRLAAVSEKRGSARKTVLGGLVGAGLGMVIALMSQAAAALKRTKSEDAREFFRLVNDVTPQFLRRGGR